MQSDQSSRKPFPKLREEAEKLRSMTVKQAAQYLLNYYGLAFVGIVLVLCVAISVASSVRENRAKDPVVVCGVLDTYDAVSGKQIRAALAEAFPEATGTREPMIMTFSSPDDSTAMMGAAQLVTYTAAGQLDLLICDETTMNYLADGDLFYRPEGESIPGYDLSGTKLGAEIGGVIGTPVYCLIFADGSRLVQALTFAEYLRQN
ncbi:MAG: hypothetical protein MJ118_00280 [Clostridia bacterium]|nr:hypothetical protein [Clostridia bacterium]